MRARTWSGRNVKAKGIVQSRIKMEDWQSLSLANATSSGAAAAAPRQQRRALNKSSYQRRGRRSLAMVTLLVAYLALVCRWSL